MRMITFLTNYLSDYAYGTNAYSFTSLSTSATDVFLCLVVTCVKLIDIVLYILLPNSIANYI